jgi:hypothetical protein
MLIQYIVNLPTLRGLGAHMVGNTIVNDMNDATITLIETKGDGNDRAMKVCSDPCSDKRTLVDIQHVSSASSGLWQIVNQSFMVNNGSVSAIVMTSDGTVVAQGASIQVTITKDGSTFKGVP